MVIFMCQSLNTAGPVAAQLVGIVFAAQRQLEYPPGEAVAGVIKIGACSLAALDDLGPSEIERRTDLVGCLRIRD